MTNPFDSDRQFEALLEYIKRSRGFDFTGYKRPSLVRRVSRRMQELAIETYSEYFDYLQAHPNEFIDLFNTLLINVTSFFRDRPAWDYLINEVIPRIVARKQPGEPVRVWSAGCATGQEAYSLAMAIAEVMGLDWFREHAKIYATDVDEDALNYARQGSYQANEVKGMSPELLNLYFEASDNCFNFRQDLRRSIIFGRHDLIQDAPISKIDLLVCRNILMYFNAETQGKILSRLHYALCNGGFLFLGKAEMLLTHANTFAPADLKQRIFTKVPKVTSRDRQPASAHRDDDAMNEDMAYQPSSYTQLQDAAFDSSTVAYVVIDAAGRLAIANERARLLFNLTLQDIGRPLQELDLAYRPVELFAGLNQVYASGRIMIIADVEWRTPQNGLVYLDVQIAPLLDRHGNVLGMGATFTNVTQYKRLQTELERSNQELEIAYEELQSTNEELETTNEELQSTNEELETTNEELQSTNEELETMNEELQSTNEELQTVNDELQRRSEESNQTNAVLESILTSLKGAVIVVNQDLQVQVWNHKAEDMWGLRSFEAIGQNFLNLDIGLPVEQVRPLIRSCLANSDAGSLEITLDAINRRGRNIQCEVTCISLTNQDRDILGVILLIEELNN
jgi:two-component system, chemotaxis family, CheB/CheR fusion protein